MKSKKKVLYKIRTASGKEIKIWVLQKIDFELKNNIVQYQTVDGDGGDTIFIGRQATPLVISFTLVDDLSKNLQFLTKLYNIQESFTITGTIDEFNIFGEYYFGSISSSITDGAESMVCQATMIKKLVSSIYKTNIVYTSSDLLTNLLNYLKAQNIEDQSLNG